MIGRLGQQCTIIHQALSAIQADQWQLETELQVSRTRQGQLESSLREVQSEKQGLLVDLDAERAARLQQEDELTAQVQQLLAARFELTQRNVELQQCNLELEQCNVELEECSESLKTAVCSLQCDLSAVQRENGRLHSEAQHLAMQLHAARSERRAKEEQSVGYEAEVAALRAEVKRLTAVLSSQSEKYRLEAAAQLAEYQRKLGEASAAAAKSAEACNKAPIKEEEPWHGDGDQPGGGTSDKAAIAELQHKLDQAVAKAELHRKLAKKQRQNVLALKAKVSSLREENKALAARKSDEQAALDRLPADLQAPEGSPHHQQPCNPGPSCTVAEQAGGPTIADAAQRDAARHVIDAQAMAPEAAAQPSLAAARPSPAVKLTAKARRRDRRAKSANRGTAAAKVVPEVELPGSQESAGSVQDSALRDNHPSKSRVREEAAGDQQEGAAALGTGRDEGHDNAAPGVVHTARNSPERCLASRDQNLPCQEQALQPQSASMDHAAAAPAASGVAKSGANPALHQEKPHRQEAGPAPGRQLPPGPHGRPSKPAPRLASPSVKAPPPKGGVKAGWRVKQRVRLEADHSPANKRQRASPGAEDWLDVGPKDPKGPTFAKPNTGLPGSFAAAAAVGARQQAAAAAATAAAPPPGHTTVDKRKEPASAPGTYKYQAVIRKKAEREALPGYECQDCAGFYEALRTWGTTTEEPKCGHITADGRQNASKQQAHQVDQMRQDASRHRYLHAPPATPEGFWDMGFKDSLDSRMF